MTKGKFWSHSKLKQEHATVVKSGSRQGLWYAQNWEDPISQVALTFGVSENTISNLARKKPKGRGADPVEGVPE